MTNVEARNNDEIRMTKEAPRLFVIRSFAIPSSFVIRASSLRSSAFLQQLPNQSHFSPETRALAQLRNRFWQTPRPVRRRSRSGNVKAVSSREQISDHHNRNPRVAVEQRAHHRRIKIALVFEAFPRRDPGKLRDLEQIFPRLFARRGSFIKGLRPQFANRFVIVGRISRDR